MRYNRLKNLAVFSIVLVMLISVFTAGCLEEDDTDDDDALITINGQNFDLEDLEDMDTVEGTARYQNRFYNWNEKAEYKGVALDTLVPDMETSDVLEVTASDGFSQEFSYRQIFPSETNMEIQGEIILAYVSDGISVPEWEDGPMIAVLPPDEDFSNDDLNMTRSLDSRFDSQSSAGSLWVKNVEEITVNEDVYSDTEIGLTLEGTTVHDYSFEELRNMDSIQGEGTRIRSTANVRGPNSYRGIYLTDLISNIYSGSEYTLQVEARDGYTMTYPREQVEGDVPVLDEDYKETDIDADFEVILAYEEDGDPVPDWEDGPRIAFLNEEGHLSEAGLWAKMVRYIRVLPEQEDWTLELKKGSETVDISKQYFESAANCEFHRAEYEEEGDVYAGVTLWEIVAAVDGGDPPDGHYMYNTVLAELGYDVVVEAGDGFSATLTSQQIARNDSIILANELNGEPLPEGEAPLRLVGEDLPGEQSVRNIVKIELTDLPDESEIPDWSLTLNGTLVRDYDAMVFGSLIGCGVHTEDFNADEGTYEGIPLWILIAAVDDGETLSHWSLNETLVERGYEVQVIAEDGYSYTFDIDDVAFNDTMILASRLNGEPLDENDSPLRLVGEGLSGEQSVRNVIEIRLVGLEL